MSRTTIINEALGMLKLYSTYTSIPASTSLGLKIYSHEKPKISDFVKQRIELGFKFCEAYLAFEEKGNIEDINVAYGIIKIINKCEKEEWKENISQIYNTILKIKNYKNLEEKEIDLAVENLDNLVNLTEKKIRRKDYERIILNAPFPLPIH